MVGLSDNPVYHYGLKLQWKRWYYVWPALLLLVLSVALMVMVWLRTAGLIKLGNVVQLAWIHPYILLLFGGATATYVIPAISPLAITREFERQSFEMLRLTRLTDVEIAMGKAAAVLAPFVTGLALSIPISVLALVVLGGRPILTLAVYVGVLLQVTASSLVGLWAGARYRRAAMAIMLSYVFTLIIVPIITGLLRLLAAYVATRSMWNPDLAPMVWAHVISLLVAEPIVILVFWLSLQGALSRVEQSPVIRK